MKRVLFLLPVLLLAIMSFIGCNKDESKDNVDLSCLIGKWEAYRMVSPEEYGNENILSDEMYMEFYGNEGGEMSAAGISGNFTYEIKEDVSVCIYLYGDAFTGDIAFVIDRLTESELVLRTGGRITYFRRVK